MNMAAIAASVTLSMRPSACGMKGAHEDANACDDESPGGPKVLPLTETALRQFRSEQPKQKDRPKAVS